MSNDLARRGLACGHYWRWMEGMKVTLPKTSCTCRRNGKVGIVRIVSADIGGCQNIHDLGICGPRHVMTGAFPDLSDPATLGCLLQLVRDAYGMDVTTTKITGRWVAIVGTGTHVIYDTEAEALVAALEAANDRVGT